MFQFIVADLLMFALGMMLYLAVRTLPRLEEGGASEKKSLIDRWFASDIPEKIDIVINQFLVKFLRRVKIALLRVDNLLTAQLKKVKPEEPRDLGKPPIDFKEIGAQKTEQQKAEIAK